MPLNKAKTKGAFGQNVSAEVTAGKPIKQALAIAYSYKEGHKGTKPTHKNGDHSR